MPRKTAFSGKQKKKQLQDKKLRKQAGPSYLRDSGDEDVEETTQALQQTVESSNTGNHNHGATGITGGVPKVQRINFQPRAIDRNDGLRLNANSFRLHFLKEDEQTINKRKKEARNSIKPVREDCREWKLEDVYPPSAKINFPKRPPWSYTASREVLEEKEQQYFNSYVDDILDQPRAQDLSFFELNLETWRQLWRVLEMSDILLLVADIRYVALHVPPLLLDYILKDLRKPVIILLNKVDFVPPSLALAWKHYLKNTFPGVHIVFFSSFPGDAIHDGSCDPSSVLQKKPIKSKYLPVGPKELCRAVKKFTKGCVDISAWEESLESGLPNPESDTVETSAPGDHLQSSEGLLDISSQKLNKEGVISIGCVGYPNAGKSSVLNALVGRKVVSVSKTPGHTKHFQTIFLCPAVRLCDCPGLVFPSMVPKSLQVIAGIFPVAQVKEPYSVISYLAKRLDLPKLLNLRPPHSSSPRKKGNEYQWSAYEICEAWAVKSGYTTSKAGRPDLFRAANRILRLAVDGQLCLCFLPPGYLQSVGNAEFDEEADQLTHKFHRLHVTSARSHVDYRDKEAEEMESDSDAGLLEDSESEEYDELCEGGEVVGALDRLHLGIDIEYGNS